MSESNDTAAAPPHRLFGNWLEASAEFATGVLRANRRLLSGDAGSGATTGDAGTTEPAASGVAFDEVDWAVETSFARAGEVTVGDVVRFSKVLSEADVAAFAAASGDTNRLHLDEEFADDTRFGGAIVHGTLVSGLVSAALARLPGLVIYLSQEMEFTGPVEPGQRATAEIEAVEDLGDDRFRFSTTVLADDEPAVQGEAVVLIDELPEE